MTGKELALKIGKSCIFYWKKLLLQNGHAEITGTGRIRYKESAIDFIKGERHKKPGAQGGGQTREKEIARLLNKRGISFVQIGYHKGGGHGSYWYYISPSAIRFPLGKNFKESIDYLKDGL